MKLLKCLPIFIFLYSVGTLAQEEQISKIHSHNDYDQEVPFWKAYSAGAHSIEADVFLKDGVLYVTHAEQEIIKERTLEKLYIKPLSEIFGSDKLIKDRHTLQLLIDVKSEAKPTLNALLRLLRQYPKLTKDPRLKFVISGSRPDAKLYYKYPNFIWFDHQDLKPISDKALEKVALISMSFRQFSNWNGKGSIAKEELQEIKETIKKAHSYNKPFRFWATPDSKSAWQAMSELRVDYINTDHPFQCMEYVTSLK